MIKLTSFFLAAFSLASLASAAESYDVLIRGGKLLDGSGAPWRYADVAVMGDRIVAVGHVAADATAKTVVDARGMYVAPGYIDPHSHASDALAVDSRAGVRALIAQGITTAVINPDGGGPAELAPQLTAIAKAKPGVNVVPLIGHNTARITAMAYEERDPTNEEVERMRGVIRGGMEAGAWGMSDGLFYSPANKSKTEEVIDLAKIVSGFNGYYTAHVRDDSDYNIGALGAVDEVIRIAREGKVPGVVTHIKTMGPRGKGLSAQMIAHIREARGQGIEVWADQYPYLASSSSMSAYLVPEWAQTGGTGAILSRLGNSEVMKGMEENINRRGGAELMQISQYAPNRAYEGKRLSEIAKELGKDPTETAVLLLKDSGGRVPVVSHTVNESDSDAFMREAWTMTCTDGGAPVFGQGVPNPRAYGTYPYKITKDVIERKVLSLEQAVHVGTGLPATVHGLRDRGFVREGAFADLQVFDLAKLKATATFEKPHAYAEGMEYVFVNGVAAVAKGEFTDARGGKVLLRSDKTVSNR